MNFKKLLIVSILTLSIIFLLPGCGDPEVNLLTVTYQPKIVVEAYVFGNESIKNIKISRNFPLGYAIDVNKLALTPSANSVVAKINGVNLSYDSNTKSYYLPNTIGESGKTYSLEITAIVDGKELKTTSVTTVPQTGFGFVGQKDLGEFHYSQVNPLLSYTKSGDSHFYVFNFVADSASTANYIYKNDFESEKSPQDVQKDLNDLKVSYGVLLDLGENQSGSFTFSAQPFRFRFYGSYTIVGYAGDTNFKDYLLSTPQVKEPDGNFHEPVRVLTGDGIGVFASAVKDICKLRIVK